MRRRVVIDDDDVDEEDGAGPPPPPAPEAGPRPTRCPEAEPDEESDGYESNCSVDSFIVQDEPKEGKQKRNPSSARKEWGDESTFQEGLALLDLADLVHKNKFPCKEGEEESSESLSFLLKAVRNARSKLKFLATSGRSTLWKQDVVDLIDRSHSCRVYSIDGVEKKAINPAGRCAFCGTVERNCFFAVDLAGTPGEKGDADYSADQFLTCPVVQLPKRRDVEGGRPTTLQAAFDRFHSYYDTLGNPSKIGTSIEDTSKNATFFGSFLLGETCLRRFFVSYRASHLILELIHESEMISSRLSDREADTVDDSRVLQFLQTVEALTVSLRDDKTDLDPPAFCDVFWETADTAAQRKRKAERPFEDEDDDISHLSWCGALGRRTLSALRGEGMPGPSSEDAGREDYDSNPTASSKREGRNRGKRPASNVQSKKRKPSSQRPGRGGKRARGNESDDEEEEEEDFSEEHEDDEDDEDYVEEEEEGEEVMSSKPPNTRSHNTRASETKSKKTEPAKKRQKRNNVQPDQGSEIVIDLLNLAQKLTREGRKEDARIAASAAAMLS